MYVSEICDADSSINIYINPILVFIFTITEMIKLALSCPTHVFFFLLYIYTASIYFYVCCTS